MEKLKNANKFILILLILFTISNLVAIIICFQRIDNIMESISKIQNVNNNTLQNNNISEMDAYKLMYENLKDSNSKIIETVYWALGAIFATIIAIVGANVFYNFSINKKEIENITKSLSITMEEVKGDMYKIIQKKIDDYINRSSGKLDNNFLIAEQKQDTQNKSFLNNINIKINSIDTRLENYIDESYSEQSEKFKEINEKIEYENNRIKIELFDCEADLWDLKQVYGNAVICYVRKGELQLKINHDVENTLNVLIKVLNKTTSLTSYYNEINIFINKLPVDYQIQKDTILKLVQKIRDNQIVY